MVPTGQVEPGAWSGEKVSMAQLSDAVGSVQVTAAEQLRASLVCVMLEGTLEITGASLSVIVTLNCTLVLFPDSSVAR